MYKNIIEQLTDYCNCIEEKDVESGLVERSINQLIQLISTITCWTNRDGVCSTFLNTDRQEVFDPNAITECGHCEYGLMSVELFYTPVQAETIHVKLLKRDGIHFEEVELTTEEFAFNLYENELMIDLRNYISCHPCNCEMIDKVIVDYVAGYDEIPDCLLPIFCDLLRFLIEMNRCECKTCEPCEMKDLRDFELTGFESEQQEAPMDYIKKVIIAGYSKQLNLISLCGKRNNFWGLVV